MRFSLHLWCLPFCFWAVVLPFSALTGMDIRAATMLLPVGVIAFVIVGGLRSTFISDYVHTTIVFVIIWLFLYTVSPNCLVSKCSQF